MSFCLQTIERYDIQECCVGMEVIWEADEGEYVKYAQHLTIVEALRKEIDEAYSKGYGAAEIVQLVRDGIYERRDVY